MNEQNFIGSELQTAFNNCKGIEKLNVFFELTKSAYKAKPQSKFWADALKAITNKVAVHGDKL